jgi:hypothetical protein
VEAGSRERGPSTLTHMVPFSRESGPMGPRIVPFSRETGIPSVGGRI